MFNDIQIKHRKWILQVQPVPVPSVRFVFSHCAVAVMMVRWPLLNASRGSIERTGGCQGKLKSKSIDVVVAHVKQRSLALGNFSNLTNLWPRAHFVLKGGRETSVP